MAFDWKSVVGTVAPSLATALGGPLAGVATTAILGVFGLESDASEETLAKAVRNATPAELAQLKKVGYDFAVQMKELDVDLERVAMADRNSARRREIATCDATPKVVASFVMVTFAATVCFTCFLATASGPAVDTNMMTLLGAVVGYVFNEVKTVTTYYFGSNAGSANKDQLLYNSTPTR
ncbi:MAG: hypothetical protein RR619_10155 [Raoultibacter sp.]